MIQLAGLEIRDSVVVELAAMLRDSGAHDTAAKLEDAVAHGTEIISLTTEDREHILWALKQPRDGLQQLRGVLLAEHLERTLQGLR